MKTQPIALEQQKRGRGRPATGAAMTPAEKQKAYRERQKKEAAADVDGQIKLLRHLLEQAREDNQRLAGKVLELRKDNDDLIKVLDEASKEKKYWIDRALKKEGESKKPRFELQYKNYRGRWVKGPFDAELFAENLMTKESADDLRARMQKESDKDPKDGLTWRIKEIK